MKSYSVLYFGILLIVSNQAAANQLHNPDIVSISAKYARLKAQQRSLNADTVKQTSQVINVDADDDSGNCDLNVGNVIIDDNSGNAPDEVIVIIEGDIIQSNNCS